MEKKDIILKIDNVSKQYRLGQVGTGTLSHDVNRWWHQVRGKENPYLKLGETNDRSTKGTSDYVWALQDINFEVERGDVLAIIGKNGAGKSTLLKILSKVTAPTTGSIKSRGRIASLLEVGTGFHGEMTGRENIFLNGAILGMTKKEIASKLDEIIKFSGCERYIDTPVKRYSSGMTVRLAFAVAAFLEPEILVVDEVLAVGDAEFQKKAIGKMQDISKGGGRTVIFVSHNMAAVKSFCTKGIVLEHGGVVFEGGIDESVDYYLNSESGDIDNSLEGIVKFDEKETENEEVSLVEVRAYDNLGRVRDIYLSNEEIYLDIKLIVREEIEKSRFALIIETDNGEKAFVSSDYKMTSDKMAIGTYILTVVIPKKILNNINYKVLVSGAIPGEKYFFKPKECFLIKIIDPETKGFGYSEKWHGVVHPILKWEMKHEG